MTKLTNSGLHHKASCKQHLDSEFRFEFLMNFHSYEYQHAYVYNKTVLQWVEGKQQLPIQQLQVIFLKSTRCY